VLVLLDGRVMACEMAACWPVSGRVLAC